MCFRSPPLPFAGAKRVSKLALERVKNLEAEKKAFVEELDAGRQHLAQLEQAVEQLQTEVTAKSGAWEVGAGGGRRAGRGGWS